MTGILKIGLIVDGPHLAKYVYDLIEWTRQTDSIQISHLIVRERELQTLLTQKNRRPKRA